MFGSGVGIFMELIPQEIKIIPMEQKVVPIVLYVAVAGATVPAIALFPFVSATVQPAATATLASAFVGFPLINFCFCTGGHCTGGRRSAVLGTGGRRSAVFGTGGRRSALFFRRYSERRYKKIFGATASAGTIKKWETINGL